MSVTARARRLLQASWILLAVLGLPLLGRFLAGRDLTWLFVFPPPLEIPTDYPKFVPTAALAILGLLLALAFAWWRGRPPASADGRILENDTRHRFPWWGWLALLWTLVSWLLAWTRFEALARVQAFTFFPLWLGFVVLVNAYIVSRRGDSLMTRAPTRWLGLFAVSAGFWWVFEWLNRFVRNWHYLGVEAFGPATYAIHASLCFSTVLPAIAAVAETLGTSRRWVAFAQRGPACPWLQRRPTALLFLAGGSLALVFTGAWPELVYPALWAAPLALLLGADAWAPPERSVVDDTAHGRWQHALTWMAAALVCGGFWEMWNVFSLAKWLYTVPGVQRWHVFEMPLLGYTGYLPFGLQCLLVVEWLTPGTWATLSRPDGNALTRESA